MITETKEIKRLFRPNELASYLAVSPKTVYKWAFYRKIPCVKLGKTLRFDRAEIDRWIETAQRPRALP